MLACIARACVHGRVIPPAAAAQEGPGVLIADAVKLNTLDSIKALPATVLVEAEDLGGNMFRKYWCDKEQAGIASAAPVDTRLKALGGVFYRMFRALAARAKPGQVGGLEKRLRQAEKELRTNMVGRDEKQPLGGLPAQLLVRLPDPFFANLDDAEPSASPVKAGTAKKGLEVDCLPLVAFNADGSLVENQSTRARDRGLGPGRAVCAKAAARGVEKGARGVVYQVNTGGLLVIWEGSSVPTPFAVGLVEPDDGKGRSAEHAAKEEVAARKKARADALPEGFSWSAFRPEDADFAMKNWRIASLYHCHALANPDGGELRPVLGSEGQVRLFASKEFQAARSRARGRCAR